MIFINLTKFDLRLTLGGIRNIILIQLSKWVGTNTITKIINFFFPMTINGLKSELKRLKYPENCKKCISTPKNYDFTKIKDYLQTGVVGYLTPSSHVTRLLNSRIMIFYPSTLY